MAEKLIVPQDQDVLMTTVEDEGVAEPRTNPMALESNEQLRDDFKFRFVTLASSRKMHHAERETIVRMPL